MKSILITSLKDEINIAGASHLANSLLKENPHAEVALLTFRDLAPAANLLNNVKEIFFLDRFKIEHFKNGPLYSDAFAMNTFAENLDPCLARHWDQVINFSNDEVSAYLAPLFDADETTGSSVSSYGSATTSDKWSAYRNFYCSQVPEAPISPMLCAHHSANIPFAPEGKRIVLNQEFSAVADKNFAKIRANKPCDGQTFLVGLNLAPSHAGRMFRAKELEELIECLENSSQYKTILLMRGSAEEKALCNELNHVFDNTLVSVNSDPTALPSVLANLDFLVSQPSFTSAVADAMGTRVIEVAKEKDESATVNAGNFVIKDLSSGPHPTGSLSNDILFILNQENETLLPVESKFSDNKIYAKVSDDFGVFNTLVHGSIDLNSELAYHITRCYHFSLLGYPMNEELILSLQRQATKDSLMRFASGAKEEMTEIVKPLLSALRCIKNVNSSQKDATQFIQSLDRLIGLGKKPGVGQAAICLFEAAVENISSQDPDQNLQEIEKNLFELKADLKMLTKTLEKLLLFKETNRLERNSAREKEL